VSAIEPAKVSLPVTIRLITNVSIVPVTRQLTALANERLWASRPLKIPMTCLSVRPARRDYLSIASSKESISSGRSGRSEGAPDCCGWPNKVDAREAAPTTVIGFPNATQRGPALRRTRARNDRTRTLSRSAITTLIVEYRKRHIGPRPLLRHRQGSEKTQGDPTTKGCASTGGRPIEAVHRYGNQATAIVAAPLSSRSKDEGPASI
jgi:hypothetical protein